jgi:hypothetical protein
MKSKSMYWQVDEMASFEMEVDEMASSQIGKLIKWQVDEMAS